jgi:hypothetical protein
MANPVHTRERSEIATAAHSLNIDPHLLDTRRPGDLGTAFDAASGHHNYAVVVGIDTVTELKAAPIASPFQGSAILTDAQVADLLAGLYYVNIHTDAYPAGEIRGQFVKSP